MRVPRPIQEAPRLDWMSVACFTVASHATPGLTRLTLSCQHHGFAPTVLGMGKPYRGNIVKLDYFIYAIEHSTADIFVFMDAYDVVAAGSLDEIIAAYRSLETPILFSAERVCWPDEGLANLYPEVDTPYRYLCSGLWAGQRDALLPLFRAAKEQKTAWPLCDQASISSLYAKNWPGMALDIEARVFQSMFFAEDDVALVEGRVRNLVTGSTPLLFHANGKSKLPVNDV